jgi:hypothetical protein
VLSTRGVPAPASDSNAGSKTEMCRPFTLSNYRNQPYSVCAQLWPQQSSKPTKPIPMWPKLTNPPQPHEGKSCSSEMVIDHRMHKAPALLWTWNGGVRMVGTAILIEVILPSPHHDQTRLLCGQLLQIWSANHSAADKSCYGWKREAAQLAQPGAS